MVEIISLADDVTDYKGISAEHGLSFFIRTASHTVLFDFGMSGAALKKNAATMGVDLSEVDIAFLSHGHIAHGGGLEYFLSVNKKAKVYCKEDAFDVHTIKQGFFHVKIGIPEYIKNNKRLVFTKNFLKIDEFLTVFSGTEDKLFHSPTNDSLERRKIGFGRKKDDFSDELNLIITDGGKKFLFVGCAHCGIINILKKAEKSVSSKINYVFGGFHLQSTSLAPDDVILGVADYLYLRHPYTKFYTCHCTGATAFELMHRKMGGQIEYIMCGDRLQLF